MNHLIIAAAGEGRRLGRREPKALVPLAGRPMISWTMEALIPLGFTRSVIAVPPGREADFEKLLGGRARIVDGGPTRTASVRRAFEELAPQPADLVCVHDAARPLVTAVETARVVAAAERGGAAIAVVPVADTVKQVRDGRIEKTLDRDCLAYAATPQVFRAALLGRALDSGRDATDEAALLEAMGIAVAAVPISRLGFKVTTAEDLEMAEAILRSRDAGHGTRDTP